MHRLAKYNKLHCFFSNFVLLFFISICTILDTSALNDYSFAAPLLDGSLQLTTLLVCLEIDMTLLSCQQVYSTVDFSFKYFTEGFERKRRVQGNEETQLSTAISVHFIWGIAGGPQFRPKWFASGLRNVITIPTNRQFQISPQNYN